jgi:hypothetical protein
MMLTDVEDLMRESDGFHQARGSTKDAAPTPPQLHNYARQHAAA